MIDESLLRLAEAAARAAGDCLRAHAESWREVRHEDPRDIKLRADIEAERIIRAHLGRDSALPIIGEEGGGDPRLVDRDEPFWVVDPLDGTYNYWRGSPHCAVSIGLQRGETPILGVVHDFFLGECFSGWAEGPLLYNGKPWESRWAPQRSGAALQTGFPHAMGLDDTALRGFFATIRSYQKIRLLGSAALALAHVAAGRTDAYVETRARLWDVTAGLALVRAAGGVTQLTRSTDGPPLAYDVWAAGRADLLPD